MRRIARLGILGAALLLCACPRAPGGDAAAADAADDEAGRQLLKRTEREVAQTEARVRTQVLADRVAALEREVELLKTNPQSLDLQTLAARVAAVEARTYAGDAAARAGTDAGLPADSPTAQQRVAAEIARKAAAARRPSAD